MVINPSTAARGLTELTTWRRISDRCAAYQPSQLLAARPQAVLLDEPTNHLSTALVEEITEALSATAAAVVLATHDR
ncbi:ABC transporter ATP-binding protein, partial [Nonomuraea sp. NPDC050383]